MPFPAVAQPRLGYIRKGLNGIEVSADVSQMKMRPLGFRFTRLLAFFKINEQPGSKVKEPEDRTGATLAQTSALLSF